MYDLVFNAQNNPDLIIGIDRTFNLGKLYLTSLCYKNIRYKKSNGTNPIKLGPMFLHREATQEQYTMFLSFIKNRIGSISLDLEISFDGTIDFGSDQEKAITNSIDLIFPEGKRKLCYLHLKDNLIHKMRVIQTS